jgi:hypothetical protein
MSHDAMSAALGICRDTLEKYFHVELTGGAAQKRGAMIDALYTAGLGGNVAAMKAYLSMKDVPAVQEEGKKAERQRAAETAGKGTVWEEIQKQH